MKLFDHASATVDRKDLRLGLAIGTENQDVQRVVGHAVQSSHCDDDGTRTANLSHNQRAGWPARERLSSTNCETASSDGERCLVLEVRILLADNEVIWRLVVGHPRHDRFAKASIIAFKLAVAPDLLQGCREQTVLVTIG